LQQWLLNMPRPGQMEFFEAAAGFQPYRGNIKRRVGDSAFAADYLRAVGSHAG